MAGRQVLQLRLELLFRGLQRPQPVAVDLREHALRGAVEHLGAGGLVDQDLLHRLEGAVAQHGAEAPVAGAARGAPSHAPQHGGRVEALQLPVLLEVQDLLHGAEEDADVAALHRDPRAVGLVVAGEALQPLRGSLRLTGVAEFVGGPQEVAEALCRRLLLALHPADLLGGRLVGRNDHAHGAGELGNGARAVEAGRAGEAHVAAASQPGAQRGGQVSGHERDLVADDARKLEQLQRHVLHLQEARVGA
eukprot:16446770-Heterocapsa_arctica.AAC.1